MSAERTPFRVIPEAALRIVRPNNWLTTRLHFYPPETSFGVLVLCNDARNGFESHPHSDMEIFSYVVDGHLTHQDSVGHQETLGRGAVQYMSAGTGVRHSEKNHGDETCRFLQVWIAPERRGLPVQYGSHTFTEEQRRNTLLQMIGVPSDRGSPPITLQQDCNVFVSEIDNGYIVNAEVAEGRQAYMVCIEGAASLNDGAVSLEMRDAVEIVGPVHLNIGSSCDKTHVILIEMPCA